MQPKRGYESLRRFRVSVPLTNYFITLCTHDRVAGLNRTETAAAIQGEITAIQAAGYWTLRAGVIMPEHLHLLLCLQEKLALGRTVARLKAKTRTALLAAGLRWQGNYYEHRLRPGEKIESVIRYIHLNPYRAKLIDSSAEYPWFWLGLAESAWFRPLTDDGKPFPSWLC